MAFQFTVEDGSGVEGANAFVSLAFVRDYHDGRGQLADWDGAAVTSAITAADAGADTLTIADHPFETGDGPVTPSGADLPAGATAGNEYWLVVVDADTIQLAASYADAIAETPVVIDLTDAGSGAMSLSHADFDSQRRSIVKATDHIERTYESWFRGVRLGSEQGLSWPRAGAYDPLLDVMLEGVPQAIKKACAEFALLDRTSTSLVASPAVISESKSIDGVARSVTYASPTTPVSSAQAVVAAKMLRSVLLSPQAVRA